MNADIARSWIVANAIALAVTAVFGLVSYGVRRLFGIDVGDATVPAYGIYMAAEIAMSVAGAALYASLTAAVLGTVVPLFPRRNWMVLHVAIGLAGGAALGLMGFQPDATSEPLDWTDSSLVVFMIAVFSILGLFAGAILGLLQALAMRRAIAGMVLWVFCSALMFGLAGAGAFLLLLLPQDYGLLAELALAIGIVVFGTAGSAVMVPAVQRLRPRHL